MRDSRTQGTMDYTELGDYRISRMTLGAAQLGFDYGVANVAGRPTHSASLEILEAAVQSGITCIDTAPAYGDSEEIIGSYITTNSCPSCCTVITKLPALDLGPDATFTEVHDVMRKHVIGSLDRLHLERLPIYLLHRASDLERYGAKILHSLTELKGEGLIDTTGVSVYTPAEVERALESDALTAIQIPVSVFDQRLLRLGLLDRLQDQKRVVFVRSVFLQGLLLLPAPRLPPSLQEAAAPLAELQELCLEHDRSVAEAALVFVRDLPGVTSLVVGAETIAQLRENIRLMHSPRLSPMLYNQLVARFTDLPVELISPAMWQL